MNERKQRHGGIVVNHRGQLRRLRRIEGQVRGLQQMIEEGRACVQVAHQINAVIAALRRVEADMLRDHLRAVASAIAADDLSDAERCRLADELAALMAKSI